MVWQVVVLACMLLLTPLICDCCGISVPSMKSSITNIIT